MANSQQATTPSRVRASSAPGAPKKTRCKKAVAAAGNTARALTFDTSHYEIDTQYSPPQVVYSTFESAWEALKTQILTRGGALKHNTAAACAADYSDQHGAPGFSHRTYYVGFTAGWPTAIGSATLVIKCQWD